MAQILGDLRRQLPGTVEAYFIADLARNPVFTVTTVLGVFYNVYQLNSAYKDIEDAKAEADRKNANKGIRTSNNPDNPQTGSPTGSNFAGEFANPYRDQIWRLAPGALSADGAPQEVADGQSTGDRVDQVSNYGQALDPTAGEIDREVANDRLAVKVDRVEVTNPGSKD